MSVSYISKRIRLALDVTKSTNQVDALTNEMPHIWRGNGVRIEIAGFMGPPSDTDTELIDFSAFASVTLQVQGTDREGTVIMEKTVLAEDLNTGLTREDWNDLTDEHASFTFHSSETAPTFDGSGALYQDYWFSVTALTADDADEITLGCGVLRIEEDGHDISTPTPPLDDPDYLTTTETIAVIKTIRWKKFYLYNADDGYYYPVSIAGTGDQVHLEIGAPVETASADTEPTWLDADGVEDLIEAHEFDTLNLKNLTTGAYDHVNTDSPEGSAQISIETILPS